MGAQVAEKLPHWPAGMNRRLALAYTGVAEKQLAEWERSGRVVFRPRGPHGEKLARRRDLDAALDSLFDSANDDSPIEF